MTFAMHPQPRIARSRTLGISARRRGAWRHPVVRGVPVDPDYEPNTDRHALPRLTRQRKRLEDEIRTIKVG
jgi:hypothetical protein